MYLFEVIEMKNGNYRWLLTAPNGHKMSGAAEGDGYPSPSAAAEAMKQSARAFARWADVLMTWRPMDGELVVKRDDSSALGMRARVVKREAEA